MVRRTVGGIVALLVLGAGVGAARAQIPVPELLSPPEGAVLDNGRSDGKDQIVWDFDWSDSAGATQYQLYVINLAAANPVISNADLTESCYHHEQDSAYIIDNYRLNWTWKVRARVGGVWGDWSSVRTFAVERVNSDPPWDIFADIPLDHWAQRAIMEAYSAGVVQGFPDGLYHPEDVVTRDQMAVFIARALAGGDALVPTPPTTATFPDVLTDSWAYRYVEYAAAQGVVRGYEDGRYHPREAVGRDQMAVFLARALAGDDGAVPPGPAAPSFPDVDEAFWAYRYIEYIAAAGVTQGYEDGQYHPEYACLRDQMAVFVVRAFGFQ